MSEQKPVTSKPEADKDLMALFTAYQKHVGTMQTEAAAMLTLAHCVRDLEKTLMKTSEHQGEKLNRELKAGFDSIVWQLKDC